jgi:hypothetical protein
MNAMPKIQGGKRKCIKVNAMSYAILVRHMLDGVYTCQDLVEITGLHLTTIYQYTRELHIAGAAHITHFEPDARGRHNIKVFKLGAGKDAKRPRMTHVERQARCRAKVAAQQLAMVMAGKGEYIPRANGRKLFQELAA